MHEGAEKTFISLWVYYDLYGYKSPNPVIASWNREVFVTRSFKFRRSQCPILPRRLSHWSVLKSPFNTFPDLDISRSLLFKINEKNSTFHFDLIGAIVIIIVLSLLSSSMFCTTIKALSRRRRHFCSCFKAFTLNNDLTLASLFPKKQQQSNPIMLFHRSRTQILLRSFYTPQQVLRFGCHLLLTIFTPHLDTWSLYYSGSLHCIVIT